MAERTPRLLPPRGGVTIKAGLPHRPFSLLDAHGRRVPAGKDTPPCIDGLFFFDERGAARFDALLPGDYKLRLHGLGIHERTLTAASGAHGDLALSRVLTRQGLEIAVQVPPGRAHAAVITLARDAEVGSCCGVTTPFTPLVEQPAPGEGALEISAGLPLHPFTLRDEHGHAAQPLSFFDEEGVARFPKLLEGKYELLLHGLGIHPRSVEKHAAHAQGDFSLAQVYAGGAKIGLTVCAGQETKAHLTPTKDAHLPACCGVTEAFARVTDQPAPKEDDHV